MLCRLLTIGMWVVLGPIILVGGGCLFWLDQLLPRYLLAAVLISPVAALAHYGWGASLKPYAIASIVLGTLLAGLWENCDLFSGRSAVWLVADGFRLLWRWTGGRKPPL
jgi:hypothetical protein